MLIFFIITHAHACKMRAKEEDEYLPAATAHLHELMHIDEHFYHSWKWKKYGTTMNAMLNQSFLIKYTVLSKLIKTLLALYECTVYS